ncbi:MAG: hypothetical protein AAB466_00475 [Verrucomicrobiota bacterium]
MKTSVPSIVGFCSSSAVKPLAERILSAKQRDAGADVSAVERELDEWVSALYGLTPEEIKLVEGAR